jgi:hypothetical protein
MGGGGRVPGDAVDPPPSPHRLETPSRREAKGVWYLQIGLRTPPSRQNHPVFDKAVEYLKPKKIGEADQPGNSRKAVFIGCLYAH